MAEFTSLNGYQVKDTVARSIAKGRNQAVAFVDYETMIEALNDMEKDEYRAGQNIYIGVVGVPDLWVYSIENILHTFEYVSDEDMVEMLKNNTTIQVGYYKLAMLEGQKVDLTTYDQKLLEHDNKFVEQDEELVKLSQSFAEYFSWYVENGWLPAIPAEGEVPANLEDCSWNMIHQLVQADTFKNYYKVGDTKSVTLSSGEVVYMQVASINDGSGDAGAWYPRGTVDFISKDCLSTMYQMNPSQSNVGGWGACNLRTQLNTSILNSLPQEVITIITEKTHTYLLETGSHAVSTDKIWLPTQYEVFGTNNSTVVVESIDHNIHYPLFPNDNSRIKRLGNNGSAASWWLSSTYNGSNKLFIGSGPTGIREWGNGNATIGVALCFRIG